MNMLFWVSEILLVLELPIGVMYALSPFRDSRYPYFQIRELLIILAVCLFRWLAGRRQRRKKPELIWLPWKQRLRPILFPLLICVPLFLHLWIHCGSSVNAADPLACVWIIYTLVAVLRIIDNLFSHWDPKQSSTPGRGSEPMVWISEALLVIALLVSSQRIIALWGQPVFWPELIWDLAMLLPACLYRWLIERRQRQEKPDLIWLPWYKRIWLTLIPLLLCARALVAFGIHYNDTPEMFEEDMRFFDHMLYWGLAFPTFLIPRILDNVFSHREAK